MMEKRYSVGSSEVILAQGDITREPTVAIVNAASGSLLGGGEVDGAIHRAAGPELLLACREVKKTLPGGLLSAGGAVLTPGFLLAAEWVIHCVGPIYAADRSVAPALLARCYQGALAICQERSFASVAFPAISTGVYGYPMADAALVSLSARSAITCSTAGRRRSSRSCSSMPRPTRRSSRSATPSSDGPSAADHPSSGSAALSLDIEASHRASSSSQVGYSSPGRRGVVTFQPRLRAHASQIVIL